MMPPTIDDHGQTVTVNKEAERVCRHCGKLWREVMDMRSKRTLEQCSEVLDILNAGRGAMDRQVARGKKFLWVQGIALAVQGAGLVWFVFRPIALALLR
jgi:hypothetical protein